jgi:AcrR family transcriptional regulator
MDAREQLLQAAIKVYSTSGVRGATTKRIAQEAQVNEVTLFRHFGSKEALLQEALARSAQALFESGLPAAPRDPANELLTLARNHYKALWEHRELIRVAMGEFGEHPESTHVACEASARFDRELKSYLAQLKVQGLASGDWDPDAAAAMLLGTLFSDVMGRDCMPQCYSLDQDAAVTEYLSLFLRAIGVETAAHVRATPSRSPEPGVHSPIPGVRRVR